jgi:DNA-binding GntR family transcriptional regulator
MEEAVQRRDWTGVNKADLAFHREICLASENDIVITLWQGLARHVLMIFGREILTELGQSQIVQQHRDFIADLLTARAKGLPHLIERHIMRLRRQKGGPRTGKVHRRVRKNSVAPLKVVGSHIR